MLNVKSKNLKSLKRKLPPKPVKDINDYLSGSSPIKHNTVYGSKDKELLRKITKVENNPNWKAAALLKTANKDLIFKVLEKDKSYYFRESVITNAKREDVYKYFLQNDLSYTNRVLAVKKATNKDTLKWVATHEVDCYIRKIALRKIYDLDVLKTAAKDDLNEKNRLIALRRISCSRIDVSFILKLLETEKSALVTEYLNDLLAKLPNSVKFISLT